MLFRSDGLEVLIVHPGGPFWARKDKGVWSIPKGEVESEEALLQAALREFREETGFDADGEALDLGEVKQKSGKRVRAFAIEGDADLAAFRSNTFDMEWPPRSGNIQSFPEVDQAKWSGLGEARERLNAAQGAFLDRLAERVSSE